MVSKILQLSQKNISMRVFSCRGGTTIPLLRVKSCIWLTQAFLFAFSLHCSGQSRPNLPANEQRFFAPDNGVERGDEFGGAIAADGDWAVAGARFDDSAFIADEGSAYVLKWTAAVPFGSWKVHQKVTMPMTSQERDRQTEGKILFGQRVAISGEWMAISAPRFKTASGRLGRIVVYKRSGDTWAVAQIIEPENSYSGYTGAAMVISNDRLAFASNHGTVHVYSRSTMEAQPPWFLHTTIDVTATNGETGICLALRDGNLLMGVPGVAYAHRESAAGHIREYGFRQFHVSLLATIPSPVFSRPNELKSFASSIAVTGDWMLVSSNGLSGTNAKVFSYRRTVATNGSVTWGLVGNTSVTGTEFAKAPGIAMNDRYAVVTTIASPVKVLRAPLTALNGPDLSSLQEIGQIFPQSMRLQGNDLYQLVAVAGDTILAADAASSAAGEIIAIPQGHRGLAPQRLSPPKSYLTAQDGMGSNVSASGNLVAVSAPEWQPTYLFNAPTPQRGTVHLYRRTNGLWEYSDSVNNVVNGPTSPAFGQLMSMNSRWLAMNGQGGVYAYRLMDGKAADLPSFTIRSKTNPNATLLNLEFDPLNESTLIVAWKNGNSGTLVERFSMPTTEKEEPTFQSVLAQTGVSNSFSMAIEKGLAAVANGSEVSVYDTAINPWKRMSGFSPEGGAIIPGATTDGLFFNAGQILAKTSVGLRAYEENSRKWMLRWFGHQGVVSAKKDALLGLGDGLVSITRPRYDQQKTFSPIPQILSLAPAPGRDQPRSPRSAILTEDSAIVGYFDSSMIPFGMVWMRSLEDLKLYDGPVANPSYELRANSRQFMGNLAQHEPTALQFTLTNAGELVTILSKEDFTLTASAQGTKLELVGWDEPRTIDPGSSMTFTLRVAPIVFPQNQTVDIVIRGPVSKRIVLNTGFSFTVAQFNPPVPEANLVEKANLVALGKSFSIRVGSEVSRSLDLQWIKDGRLLKGQTFPVLSIDAVKASDAGVYRIRVQNRYGQSVIAGVHPLGVYDYQERTLHKRRSDPFSLSLNAWGPGMKVRWNEGQDTAFIQGSRTMTLRVSRASEIWYSIAANLTLGSAEVQASRYLLNLIPETALIWKNGTSLTLENGNPWPYGIQMAVVGEEPLSAGSFKVSGLPPGITYDAETNTFQGIPTKIGTYDLIVTGSFDGLPTPPPLKVRVYVNASPRAAFYPQGSWAGIVNCFAPNDLDQLLPGLLKLNMTGVGRFSGLWIIGDRRLNFTAQYRGDADSAVVKIPNYSSAGDLQLTFGYSGGYADTSRDAITLDVSIIRDASAVASIQSSLKRVLAPTTATSRIVGRYSAFIEQAIDQFSVGSGLMSFSVTPKHDIASVGTFANGQGFTGSGTILDNGSSKQLLHYAFAKPGDTLFGSTELKDDLTFQETKEMSWKSEPSPKSRLYPEGFELGVQLVGAKHFTPAPGMLLFGGIDQSTPTVFSLEHTSLFPEPIRSIFRLTTQHTAVFPAPNRNRLRMDFFAPTGFFTGSFTTTDLLTNQKPFTRNANFRGMLIPGINRGSGFFLMPALPDPLNEPSVKSSQTLIYSGKVSLGISE
jgi:FG-GAP repeat